ncbi:hypothetical protein QYM36_010974 [Artemia franciscana]|uniref:SLC26A/SulP transporter domain-containing protein n=1 Tax=Artemia franciscana TaxID=6661 RepID=A0AA88L0P8_ARTSF|nr:hypothetical protein QYM36_010974 [Artemia franciscana]
MDPLGEQGCLSDEEKNKPYKSKHVADYLQKRLPILKWLPEYKMPFLFNDILAGTTVSLTVIPQGIAYAAVAGLPLQYGLYTAFVAPFILVFFSTVPAVTLGPTAVMALMSLPYVTALGPEAAGLMSLLAGMFILLCGLLNLGFLTELISGTVLAGFCSAAATRIMTMQFRQLLGLKIPGNGFIDVLNGIILNIQDTKITDFVLGIITILAIIFLKNLSALLRKCQVRDPRIHKVTWYLCVGRNALAIAAGCIISFYLSSGVSSSLTLTGYIEPGVPVVELPSFSFNVSKDIPTLNGTITDTTLIGFLDSLQFFGLGIILLAVVSILEHIAIAKSTSSGKSVDSSQELCSLGIANIFGAFVGAFPVTASFARSAVQKSSGCRTPLCNFFVSAIVLLSIMFMTDIFYYIPKASLAAVIISAVAPMIEYHEIPYLWKVSRLELVPFFATYFVCLLTTIELGIVVGTAIHLVLVAFHTTRKAPEIRHNQEWKCLEIVLKN